MRLLERKLDLVDRGRMDGCWRVGYPLCDMRRTDIVGVGGGFFFFLLWVRCLR